MFLRRFFTQRPSLNLQNAYYHCSTTNKKIPPITYVSSTHSQEKSTSSTFFPLCIDCKYYVPMEHSPLYPNSACNFTKPIQMCIVARSKDILCGKSGKNFSHRNVPISTSQNV